MISSRPYWVLVDYTAPNCFKNMSRNVINYIMVTVLLYRAPELLRISSSYITSFQPIGTQKGDVYSFGIILYELFSRHGPFGESGLSAAEILNRIIHCGAVPFR